jgi:uncharacterized delta-60 repeat protein
MSAFNFYYDFQDCVQPITGTPITYVVGSNISVTGGTFNLQSINNPYEIVCATFYSASTSTASTHSYITEYGDCESCLSSNTKVVTVSGCVDTIGLTLLVDKRFKKNDIVFLDVVYEDSGIEFLRTPAIITNILPFTYESYIPKLINYVPYNTCNQAIESNGIYYLVEDCSGGTQSIILSHQPFYDKGSVVNLPYGDSSCKTVVSSMYMGDWSDVSGGTPILESSLVFNDCKTCLDTFAAGGVDGNFQNATFTGGTGNTGTTIVNSIATQSDGKIIAGGDFTVIDDGTLNYINNIVRFNADGTIDDTFNSVNQGSLLLSQDNYTYSFLNNEIIFDGDFTIEFWLNYIDLPIAKSTLISYVETGYTGWELHIFDSGEIEFEYSGTQLNFGTTLSPNNWYHVALVRENDVIDLYINGALDVNSGNTVTDTLKATTGTTFYIGTNWDKTSYIDANITNIRITNSSVYSGEFEPKRTPLTLNQSSYGNINSIISDDVQLLMNFKSESSFLVDESNNSSSFILSVPAITPITYTPIPTSTFKDVFSGKIDNSFYTLNLPDNYKLDLFGKEYDTIYLDSNNYITFDQGSGAGSLVLPEQIPSEVGSSGLFLSSYDNVFSDNSSFISRISTGFTDNGESFVVRVQGGLKSSLNAFCRCYMVTISSNYNLPSNATSISIIGRPCTTSFTNAPVTLFTMLPGETSSPFCAWEEPIVNASGFNYGPFITNPTSAWAFMTVINQNNGICQVEVQPNGATPYVCPPPPVTPTTTPTTTNTPTITPTKTVTRTVTRTRDADKVCWFIQYVPNPDFPNGTGTFIYFPPGLPIAYIYVTADNPTASVCYPSDGTYVPGQLISVTITNTLCVNDGDCVPETPTPTATVTKTLTPTITQTITSTPDLCLSGCYIILSTATNPGLFYSYNFNAGTFTQFSIPGLNSAIDVAFGTSTMFTLPQNTNNIIRRATIGSNTTCFPDGVQNITNIVVTTIPPLLPPPFNISLGPGLSRNPFTTTESVLAAQIGWIANTSHSVVSIFTAGINAGTTTVLFNLGDRTLVDGDIKGVFCNNIPTIFVTTVDTNSGPPVYRFEQWSSDANGVWTQDVQIQMPFSSDGIFVWEDNVYIVRKGFGNGIYRVNLTGPWTNPANNVTFITNGPAGVIISGADNKLNTNNCDENICVVIPPDCSCHTFTTGGFTTEIRFVTYRNCQNQLVTLDSTFFLIDDFTYGPFCVSNTSPITSDNIIINELGSCTNDGDCDPPNPPCACVSFFVKFGTEAPSNQTTISYLDCQGSPVVLTGLVNFPIDNTSYGPFCVSTVVNTINVTIVDFISTCTNQGDCVLPETPTPTPTKTMTPTVTRTLTKTPTNTPLPQCDVFLLWERPTGLFGTVLIQVVRLLGTATQTQIGLPISNNSVLRFGFCQTQIGFNGDCSNILKDIAHSYNVGTGITKIWVLTRQLRSTQGFYESRIFEWESQPYTLTFTTQPTVYTLSLSNSASDPWEPGNAMTGVDFNRVLVTNTAVSPNRVIRLTLNSGVVTSQQLFNLLPDVIVQGDIMLTSTNKLIFNTRSVNSPFVNRLYQYNYTTFALETIEELPNIPTSDLVTNGESGLYQDANGFINIIKNLNNTSADLYIANVAQFPNSWTLNNNLIAPFNSAGTFSSFKGASSNVICNPHELLPCLCYTYKWPNGSTTIPGSISFTDCNGNPITFAPIQSITPGSPATAGSFCSNMSLAQLEAQAINTDIDIAGLCGLEDSPCDIEECCFTQINFVLIRTSVIAQNNTFGWEVRSFNPTTNVWGVSLTSQVTTDARWTDIAHTWDPITSTGRGWILQKRRLTNGITQNRILEYSINSTLQWNFARNINFFAGSILGDSLTVYDSQYLLISQYFTTSQGQRLALVDYSVGGGSFTAVPTPLVPNIIIPCNVNTNPISTANPIAGGDFIVTRDSNDNPSKIIFAGYSNVWIDGGTNQNRIYQWNISTGVLESGIIIPYNSFSSAIEPVRLNGIIVNCDNIFIFNQTNNTLSDTRLFVLNTINGTLTPFIQGQPFQNYGNVRQIVGASSNFRCSTVELPPSITPTPTVTATLTKTPTKTPTRTVTKTVTPTVTKTPTRTVTSTKDPICRCHRFVYIGGPTDPNSTITVRRCGFANTTDFTLGFGNLFSSNASTARPYWNICVYDFTISNPSLVELEEITDVCDQFSIGPVGDCPNPPYCRCVTYVWTPAFSPNGTPIDGNVKYNPCGTNGISQTIVTPIGPNTINGSTLTICVQSGTVPALTYAQLVEIGDLCEEGQNCVQLTETPTPTPTKTPTRTITNTPTRTITPTKTVTQTLTSTPTPTLQDCFCYTFMLDEGFFDFGQITYTPCTSTSQTTVTLTYDFAVISICSSDVPTYDPNIQLIDDTVSCNSIAGCISDPTCRCTTFTWIPTYNSIGNPVLGRLSYEDCEGGTNNYVFGPDNVNFVLTITDCVAKISFVSSVIAVEVGQVCTYSPNDCQAITPTPTATSTVTPTKTPTRTNTPTVTKTITKTITQTNTVTQTGRVCRCTTVQFTLWGVPNASGFVTYRPCDQPNSQITLPLNNNQPFQTFCTEYPLQGSKYEIVSVDTQCNSDLDCETPPPCVCHVVTYIGPNAGGFRYFPCGVFHPAEPTTVLMPSEGTEFYVCVQLGQPQGIQPIATVGDVTAQPGILCNFDSCQPVSPTPTPTNTKTPTVTPTVTGTKTQTPTSTKTPTVTPTVTKTLTITPTITHTITITPTITNTSTVTPTKNESPTPTPTITKTITRTPTVTPTNPCGTCETVYLSYDCPTSPVTLGAGLGTECRTFVVELNSPNLFVGDLRLNMWDINSPPWSNVTVTVTDHNGNILVNEIFPPGTNMGDLPILYIPSNNTPNPIATLTFDRPCGGIMEFAITCLPVPNSPTPTPTKTLTPTITKTTTITPTITPTKLIDCGYGNQIPCYCYNIFNITDNQSVTIEYVLCDGGLNVDTETIFALGSVNICSPLPLLNLSEIQDLIIITQGQQCCGNNDCNISPNESPTPTKTITQTPTVTPTITPTVTISQTITSSLTVSPTVTQTVTKTSTVTPTVTQTPTLTQTITATLTQTSTVTRTRTPQGCYCFTFTNNNNNTSVIIPFINCFFEDDQVTVFAGVNNTASVCVYNGAFTINNENVTATISDECYLVNNNYSCFAPSPTPTQTSTVTATPTVTKTLTATPTSTITPTITSTQTQTVTVTPTVTKTSTVTQTQTVTTTQTVTQTPTLTKTVTVTPTLTVTSTVTNTPTVTTTITPTITKTSTPTVTRTKDNLCGPCTTQVYNVNCTPYAFPPAPIVYSIPAGQCQTITINIGDQLNGGPGYFDYYFSVTPSAGSTISISVDDNLQGSGISNSPVFNAAGTWNYQGYAFGPGTNVVTISIPCGGSVSATFQCADEANLGFTDIIYKFYSNNPGVFDVIINSNKTKGLVNPNSGISNGSDRYQQIFDGSSLKAYRFNSNGGQLNLPQFSTKTPLLIGNGVTNNGDGDTAQVKSLTVLNDNKILVGGEFTMYNETSVNNLIKLNNDGTFDSTFIQNSISGIVNSTFVNTDGSIIVGGDFTVTGMTSSYTNLVKLTKNGNLDTTFKVGNGFNGPVNVVKSLSDKTIVVGGKFTQYQGGTARGLVRLNSDGSLLTNYKGGFNVSSSYTPNVSDVVAFYNGTILVVGGDSDSNSWLTTFQGVNTPTNIVKLKSNGYVDQTFSSTTGFDGYVLSVSEQFDGKLIIGGYFDCYEDVNGSTCGLSGLTRLNSNGLIDDTFPDLSAFDGPISKTFIKPNTLELYVGGEFETPYDRLVKIYAGGRYQLYEFTGCNGTLGFVYLPTAPTNNVVKARVNQSTVICGYVGSIVVSGDTNIFYSEGNTYYTSCSECNEIYQVKLLVREAGKSDYVINRTMTESQIDKVLTDGPIFSTGGPEIYEILDFWLGSDNVTEVPPTPTPSVTKTPTVTKTATVTKTITPTITTTIEPTQTSTPTPTVTKTITATITYTPSVTETTTQSPTITKTVTPTQSCLCLSFENTGTTEVEITLMSCESYEIYIKLQAGSSTRFCCTSVISTDPSVVQTNNGPCSDGRCPGTPTPTPSNTLTPTITPTPTQPEKAFISVWSGSSVTLPYNGIGTYSGTIDWGDGSVSANTFANRTHTYSGSGTWTITITGTITGWASSNAPTENNKLLEIKQWNNVKNVFGQAASFSGCSNLVLTGVTDTYDFNGVTNTLNMFPGCTSITTINNISSWNVSGVTNLGNMFNGCINFNDDISTWDVSNVISVSNMLYSATSFNQNLGSWDISNVSGFSDFMAYCGISTANYDNTLVGWANLTLQTGRYFGAYGLTYTSAGAGGTARSSIISNYSWSFVGDSGV